MKQNANSMKKQFLTLGKARLAPLLKLNTGMRLQSTIERLGKSSSIKWLLCAWYPLQHVMIRGLRLNESTLKNSLLTKSLLDQQKIENPKLAPKIVTWYAQTKIADREIRSSSCSFLKVLFFTFSLLWGRFAIYRQYILILFSNEMTEWYINRSIEFVSVSCCPSHAIKFH